MNNKKKVKLLKYLIMTLMVSLILKYTTTYKSNQEIYTTTISISLVFAILDMIENKNN